MNPPNKGASGPEQFPAADAPLTRNQVRSHALETFGEESKANHWLNRPNHLFSGKTPAEVLETEPESVELELIRIDHGIFA
jgi:uncharacterized protein (DUF2384 family)